MITMDRHFAFRQKSSQVSAEGRRSRSIGGNRPAADHRAHHRADAHALCQHLGRQLHRRAGRRVLQAVCRSDRHPDPHRHAGFLRQDQGAGADRQLRVRHDLDQLHAMAARQPRRSRRADRLEHRRRRTRCRRARSSPTAHGIAQNILGTALCYRSDKFPNGAPKSWADFWDVKKFPGNRSLCLSDSPRNLIYALIADGVPIDKLYPLDMDRAFKKLDQIKPHIKVWWREGNQSQQLLRDGEVDMMSIWNARATELKQQGVPVEVVWNGAVRSISSWCVLKGAPEPEAGLGTDRLMPRRPSHRPSSTRACSTVRSTRTRTSTFRRRSPSSCRPTRTIWRCRWENDQWEVDRIAQIEERFNQWLSS